VTTVGQLLETARGAVQAGQFKQAESLYRQLTRQVPEAAELWAELGFVELKLDRVALAVGYLERAASLGPGNPVIAGNLATAYRMAKRPDAAIAAYRRALEIGSPTPELLNNLALALKETGHRDEALTAFDQAVALRGDYANGHLNRANLLRDLGRLADAVDGYRRVLDISPRDAGAHCALGSVCYDLGQFDEAMAHFDRAIAIDPQYAEPRRNRALIWLARGDFLHGWREYDQRLGCEGGGLRTFEQPRWDGTPLAGRALLAYPEQGLGDTLQFVRYLPWVERTGGTVWFETPAALAPILASSGLSRFLVPQGTWPEFDVHCPLLSLPGWCGNPVGHPFWPGHYLSAAPDRATRWREVFDKLDGFKIGIAWAGNPGHPHDRYRSAKLVEFAPLAAIEGVRLISLQIGAPRGQIAQLDGRWKVVDLGDDFDESGGAFMDAAAVIEQLDLVVSVDTSLAHLAGGMGRDVWVALEYSPDWRWRDHGDHTAWYPSMRLFRQTTFDDWEQVFQEIAASVRSRLATGP
jgi:tetratricopeptide (TPR) repeat protein